MAQPVRVQAQLPYDIAGLVVQLQRIVAEFGVRLNGALQKDGSESMTGPIQLASYATADLPAAADYEGTIVYDSTTNQVKFSDGSTWTAL